MKEKYTDVIALWPSFSSLAEDIEGVTQQAVYKWSTRNSIPPRYWVQVIASARKHKIAGINISRFVEIESTPNPKGKTNG